MSARAVVRVRLVTLSLLSVLVLAALGGARVDRAEAVATDLFISEYVEGSSNNKAIEIFNGTAAPVVLGAGGVDYWVRTFSNGQTIAQLVDRALRDDRAGRRVRPGASGGGWRHPRPG